MRIPFRPYPPMAEADHDGGQQNWKIELKGGGSGTCSQSLCNIAILSSPLGMRGDVGWRKRTVWEEMEWT